MECNINLLASLKVSKPDNNRRAVGFPNSVAERAYDFRDSLKAAVRSRSQNETRSDDSTALKKELVSKAEPKLNRLKKFEAKDKENFKSVEEIKEEKTDNKEATVDEILSKLEELVNLQQMGDIPVEKQAVILENIKEALSELTEVQAKGITGLETEKLQNLVAELTVVLESMQEELKAYGSLTDMEAPENFADYAKELKTIVAETSAKAETASKRPADNIAQEQLSGKSDSKENILTEDKSGNELSVKESAENDNMTNMSSMTKVAEEKQKQGMKTETPITDTKQVTKEVRSATEESKDDVKTALDSKVEKVTVSGKESNKLDSEAGTDKEAAQEAAKVVPKEVHKPVDTVQNKTVNEEMAAINLEQTVIDNKQEAVQNQAAAPKAQTLNKAEVINQIVKKAEIILTGLQSEMKMQLEPENLGKLTLNIAVEKGLITAKFVAESHEVKQIIESNFNELKDMLQEKGLEVQNFSVSVGQDSKEYNNGNAFDQWKETVRLNSRSMNKASYGGYLQDSRTAIRAVNPYSVHNGEFDHRA